VVTNNVTYVEKACAYITRGDGSVLVFDGPGHEAVQIPKGTVETGENPRDALYREVVEESGLTTFEGVDHLVTDVWTRRESPPKRYVRNFYHVRVHEPRDAWTHVVTGTGAERGAEFEFSWLDVPADTSFALALDDYLHMLGGVETGQSRGATAD